MSKFTPGKMYVSTNNPNFTMKIKTRGTKYISGTIYLTEHQRNWSPKLKTAVVDIVTHRYPFEKLEYHKYYGEDSVWVYFPEFDIRVGFQSH